MCPAPALRADKGAARLHGPTGPLGGGRVQRLQGPTLALGCGAITPLSYPRPVRQREGLLAVVRLLPTSVALCRPGGACHNHGQRARCF